MLFELGKAINMSLVLITIKSYMAIYANKGSWPASSKGMVFHLFFLERGIAVQTNKSNHRVVEEDNNVYDILTKFKNIQ